MFILRKVYLDGHESNFSLGEVYSYVGQEENPEEFEKTMNLNGLRESTGGGGIAYAFIVSEGGMNIYPLFKTQYNYIMTGKGDTFANVSFKMSHADRVILRDNTKEVMSDSAKRSLEIRQAPANYPLSEVLTEMKYGRPALQQEYLDKVIKHIDGKNPGPGVYELRTEYNESANDGPYSVYIATDEDPDNALLAGYGFSYFEALENFMKNMEDTRFDFDENLNVIDPVIYQSKK